MVPRGYANGLITMEPNTVIQYFVDSPYSPQHEKSMLYSSVKKFDDFVKNYTDNPHLSEKDRDGFLWEEYRKTL
jgi:dTDP-4-dehydrorhamnose 3,5-epimerase